jgi:hypothetical protein
MTGSAPASLSGQRCSPPPLQCSRNRTWTARRKPASRGRMSDALQPAEAGADTRSPPPP